MGAGARRDRHFFPVPLPSASDAKLDAAVTGSSSARVISLVEDALIAFNDLRAGGYTANVACRAQPAHAFTVGAVSRQAERFAAISCEECDADAFASIWGGGL